MRDTDGGLRFHCEYSAYSDAFRLHIVSMDWVDGALLRGSAKPLEFEAMRQGDHPPERPAIELVGSEAQALIDTLWSVGLRPTQGKQSEGVTAAQDRHLQDMRAIAFAKLNVDLP